MKNINLKHDTLSLREEALALLKKKKIKHDFQTVDVAIQELIQELEVHQVELELQNEKLMTAQSKSEESSRKYKELYDFAPACYFTLSKEGEVIDLNFSGANLIGKERSAFRNNKFVFFVAEESLLIFEQFLQRVFSDFRKETCEVVLIDKHDKRKDVYISGRSIENGERCLVNVVDVSAFRLVEKKIIEQNNQLAIQNQENEKQAAELALINKELVKQIKIKELLELKLILARVCAEENDRLKSTFLANMSHEIRTPINGILGFAELLREPNLTIEKRDHCIDIIHKGGDKMLNIVNDIIDISKIEAGLMKTKLSETNVNEQIRFIFDFFRKEAAQKGLKLTVKKTLPSSKAVLTTDGEKFYAILTNLVKNSIKYTFTGSIELGYHAYIRRHHRKQPLEQHQKKKYDIPHLVFYVKDTGMGIPVEMQKYVFDRFVQADEDDKLLKQGAGLGLAITKAYVEMLGGRIWLESEPGKGSVFYFSLPYRNLKIETQEKPRKTISTQEKAEPKKLKILIAEDDEISKELITANLEQLKEEIIDVTTGLDAVEAVRNNPDIDLVLMDIKMPGIDGYEATKLIREFNTDVIIIAETAFALAGDREKALESGCNDYIAKPIYKNQLKEMIMKYLN